VADVFRAVQAAKKNAETRVSEAEYTLLMGRLSGRDFDLIQRAIDAALAEQHAQGEAVAWYDGNTFYANTESASMCCADMSKLRPVYYATPAPSVQDRRSLIEMVDAAMIEMSNIHPPLKRSECERLIRAAMLAVAPEPPQ